MHTSNQATESYRDLSYVAVKKKSRQRRDEPRKCAIYCIYPIRSKRNKNVLLKSHSQSHSKELFTNYKSPSNPKPVNYAAHCTPNFKKHAGKSSARLSRGFSYRIGKSTLLCFALERKKKEERRKEAGAYCTVLYCLATLVLTRVDGD